MCAATCVSSKLQNISKDKLVLKSKFVFAFANDKKIAYVATTNITTVSVWSRSKNVAKIAGRSFFKNYSLTYIIIIYIRKKKQKNYLNQPTGPFVPDKETKKYVVVTYYSLLNFPAQNLTLPALHLFIPRNICLW